jgi:hypothetical protein
MIRLQLVQLLYVLALSVTLSLVIKHLNSLLSSTLTVAIVKEIVVYVTYCVKLQ